MIINNAKEYTATVMLCNSITTVRHQLAQDENIPKAIKELCSQELSHLQDYVLDEVSFYLQSKLNSDGNRK